MVGGSSSEQLKTRSLTKDGRLPDFGNDGSMRALFFSLSLFSFSFFSFFLFSCLADRVSGVTGWRWWWGGGEGEGGTVTVDLLGRCMSCPHT